MPGLVHGSCDLAVEFVEDVKAKAKISDGVAARVGRFNNKLG